MLGLSAALRTLVVCHCYREAEDVIRITPSAPPDPDRHVEHREVRAAVESVLADLPPDYALTFHLRVRQEFSYAEIAEMRGESPGTLRSRVHHTLKRVRQLLTGAPGPGPGAARKEDDTR